MDNSSGSAFDGGVKWQIHANRHEKRAFSFKDTKRHHGNINRCVLLLQNID
jgi:hypothetical protein